MKRLSILLVLLMMSSSAYGASQWSKNGPLGTSAVADLDYNIATVNNEALDRLVSNYRRDCTVSPNSVSTLSVLAGELVIPNSDASVIRWRKNTTTTTVTWSDIDAGVEAPSTQYYIWAIADSDATTFTLKISTSASAPTGATYYRKIGYFYNNSSSNIVSVGNIKGGDVSNAITVNGTSDISSASASLTDMTDMVIYFVSSGRPSGILFDASIRGTPSPTISVSIDIDGTDYRTTQVDLDNQYNESVPIHWLGPLTAGAHTIKIKWSSTSTLYQDGTTEPRRLTVMEL